MKYKEGLVVIKITGGNKMTIDTTYITDGNYYICFWFDDEKLYKETFKESEIVSLSEYEKILKMEERNIKVRYLINGL